MLAVWAVQGSLVQPRFTEVVGLVTAVDEKDVDEVSEAGVLESLGGSVAHLSKELLGVTAQAQSLAVMLQAMTHLQQTYGFSDARCQVFDEAAPVKDNAQKVCIAVREPH